MLKTQLDEAVTFNITLKLALFSAGALSNRNNSMKKNVTTLRNLLLALQAVFPAPSFHVFTLTMAA